MAEPEPRRRVKRLRRMAAVSDSEDDSDDAGAASPPVAVDDVHVVTADEASAKRMKPAAEAEPSETKSQQATTAKPAVASFFQPRPKPQPATAADKPAVPPSKPAAAGASSMSSYFTRPAAATASEAAADTPGSSSSAAVAAAVSLRSGMYDPVASAGWKQGEDVPYSALCALLRKLSDVSGRLVKEELVCNFLRSVIALTPRDLLPCVYLCVNRLAPAFHGVELGIGDAILLKAVSEATGRKLADVRADLHSTGDLGTLAEAARSSQSMLMRPKPLTVVAVFETFRAIADMSGASSQDKKATAIKKLLVAANPAVSEARFLVRGLQGRLRVGFAESSLLVSLAQAITITPPHHTAPIPDVEEATSDPPRSPVAGGEAGTYASVLDSRSPSGKPRPATDVTEELAAAVATLKMVYSELPDYGEILPRLLEAGVARARACCGLRPGVPVAPMLAKPTKGVAEVLNRFEKARFTCEFKYDGERAQVHCVPGSKTIRVFSRNSEETTTRYPDLAHAIADAAVPGVDSFILDGEVVAYAPDTGKLLPFQTLSTRARKDVKEEDIKVRVIYQAFDILFVNGESMIRKPLIERRAALRSSFHAVEHKFRFAEGIDAGGEDGEGLEQIQEFLDVAVKGNCEGLMIKTLTENASYEPSRRSLNWLKLKKDYMDGLTDSFDLVPIGAWHGKGKRTGVYGAYLLACYNPETEEFESICKIGTGFSEEDLKTLHDSFQDGGRIAPSKPVNVRCQPDPRILPEVWLQPESVWEVKAADLSISPVHVAAVGLVDDDRGIALRFPRFTRIRDDKRPEDATSSEQVADMYRKQPVIAGAGGGDDDDDDGDGDD